MMSSSAVSSSVSSCCRSASKRPRPVSLASSLVVVATVCCCLPTTSHGFSGEAMPLSRPAFVGGSSSSSSALSASPLPLFAASSMDFASASAFASPVRAAEAENGMPWETSIDPKLKQQGAEALLYMPFWEWQMSFMEQTLTDLRVLPCESSESGADVSFKANEGKKARIVNLHLTSKEYSKIRMTYYDAGEATQVFNSVWYPAEGVDAPVLGIDLLAFNRKKYLAIVDFQPVHEQPEKARLETERIEQLLSPIKAEYPNLKGQMSSKFYDETKFFSQQLLFSRFDDETIVDDELLPAFQKYVKAHVGMVRAGMEAPVVDATEREQLRQRYVAYDAYSAERDPATGLFTSMFGADWADDFVYGFLFSKSREGKPKNVEAEQQAPEEHQHQPRSHSTSPTPSRVVVPSVKVSSTSSLQQQRSTAEVRSRR